MVVIIILTRFKNRQCCPQPIIIFDRFEALPTSRPAKLTNCRNTNWCLLRLFLIGIFYSFSVFVASLSDKATCQPVSLFCNHAQLIGGLQNSMSTVSKVFMDGRQTLSFYKMHSCCKQLLSLGQKDLKTACHLLAATMSALVVNCLKIGEFIYS